MRGGITALLRYVELDSDCRFSRRLPNRPERGIRASKFGAHSLFQSAVLDSCHCHRWVR